MRSLACRVCIVASLIMVIPSIGCTMLIPWNPLFKGAEMDREVSFNVEGIAVKLSRVGFVNSTYGPLVYGQVANFTDDVVTIVPAGMSAVLRGDTLMPQSVSDEALLLRPGERKKFDLFFESFIVQHRDTTDGRHRYQIPDETLVLLLGEARIGRRIIALPEIEYTYAYSPGRRSKFL